MDLLQTFASPAPELIWGLLSRGIGLVLLISFASLSAQVLALAGRDGITPVAEALAAIRRDFPAPQRYFYFPTLLWLCSSDRVLWTLPRIGMLLSASIVVGGSHAPWAFFACYVIYLSLDRAVTLVYPWDCLLFEATFWATFLPPTWLLPQLQAATAPLPAVAWIYRLMIFRVMVGFGKHKFLGSTKQDAGFLKGFFVNQPIPTPFGLLVQRLPLWFHKAALALMFLLEIPAAFAVFFPGALSTLAGLGTILLMIGIQLTGNFGYFNVAMAVLSLSWLDNTTAQALTFTGFFDAKGPWLVHSLAMVHTGLALVAFPFNSFCAHSWMLWSPFFRLRMRPLTWPVTLTRLLHPLRLVHAYGVFPPQSPPPIKLAPVTEVSWDGEHFEPLHHRYFPTTSDSPATYCAPHHERFDQAMIYEGSGVNESMLYRNIAGRFDPYGHGGMATPQRMLERVVAGTLPARPFYDRAKESKLGPPTHARTRVHMLEPALRENKERTGNHYRSTLVGPHFPPVQRGDQSPRPDWPAPELWHFEDVLWLNRSRFGQLARRSSHLGDPHSVACAASSELDEADVAAFWESFLPAIPVGLRDHYQGLRKAVLALRQEFGAERLCRMERIANRYGILLFFKLFVRFNDRGLLPAFGMATPTLNVPSLYHLRLLCLDVVSKGRDEFDRVWQDPALASDHIKALTMHSGHMLQAIFRYETMVYQSQKLRLLQSVLTHEGRPSLTARQQNAKDQVAAIGERLWGALEAVRFLRTQFATNEDILDLPERWPRFRIQPSGEVTRILDDHQGPPQL